MFYERLNEICKGQGTTPTALIKSLGYSSSKVTAWKNGSIPKYEILLKLSGALRVPVAQFFSEGTAAWDTSLTKQEQFLLDSFRALNEMGKEYILQTLEMAKMTYKKSDTVSDMEKVVG